MPTDISVVRDVAAVAALIFATTGATVGVLTLRRNARVQKAQFIADLTKDLFDDSELRQFYYKVDYEHFQFDPSEVMGFKCSQDEQHLDALLYRYNMVGRMVRLGVLDRNDIEFLIFEISQVFKNEAVAKYIQWLDEEFKKHGTYGGSSRRRPFDDARWLLERLGRSRSRGRIVQL